MDKAVRFDILFLFGIWVLFFGFSSLENSPQTEEYPDHLTGAFTGGFGEQTCHSCHFDYDLNWSEGSLLVSGLPDELLPAQDYSIKIKVHREDLGKAGFQLSARDSSGRQAGIFKISENERIMFTGNVPDSLQYVQHSPKGTEPDEPGRNHWVVEWGSPAILPDFIFFNIASNAANGDASEFGDWIYSKQIVISTKEN